MAERPAHTRHHLNANTESGFAIYLVLGFIILVTLNLTSIGQHLTQQNKIQFRSIADQKLMQKAHMATQFGLLDMRSQAADIAADESGYTLPAGVSDSDVASHRQVCLTSRGSFSDTNAANYLPSTVVETEGIEMRYFLHDASAGSTPRKFEIYGCAIRNDRTRLAYGVWTFDAATQTYSLVKTELF